MGFQRRIYLEACDLLVEAAIALESIGAVAEAARSKADGARLAEVVPAAVATGAQEHRTAGAFVFCYWSVKHVWARNLLENLSICRF